MRIVFILILSVLFTKLSIAQVNCSDVCGPNLITNPGFEAGNTGFSTGFQPITGDNPPTFWECGGRYTLAKSAVPYSGQDNNGSTWTTTTDHSGNGNFLIADPPCVSDGIIAWEAQINVKENTLYIFSAWVSNICSSDNLPVIRLKISGNDVAAKEFIYDATQPWEQLCGSYLAPVTGQVLLQVEVRASVDGISGADFGLDDLSFRPVSAADAGFTYQRPDECKNQVITFTPDEQNGTHYWNFGSANAFPATSSQPSPSVSYSEGGTYTVTHTITSPISNCQNTYTLDITVDGTCSGAAGCNPLLHPCGKNLVTDPGFEDYFTNGEQFFSEFSYHNGTGTGENCSARYLVQKNATAILDDNEAKWETSADHTSGNGYFMISDPTCQSIDGGKVFSQSIPVVAGNTYKLSAWVSALVEGGAPVVALKIRLAGIEQVIAEPTAIAFSNDPAAKWIQLCGTYDAPVTEQVSFIVEVSSSYDNVSQADFGLDDLGFYEVSEEGNSSSAFNASACGSYTVPSGKRTYTQNGIYLDTISNAAGCDSLMTIHLTIKNATNSTLTASACESYTLNSQSYTASGTYTQTLTNAAGCDSVITLNLIIKNNSVSTVTASSCNSYTLNGQNYTASGTYTQTLTNAAGCDSTITLNLTIQKNSGTVSETACESYTLNGQTYTASGTYTQMLTNAAGCDSTLTLNLTIKNSTSESLSASHCESYTLNSQTYTASGTYTQTLTNTAGCDSVLTLNLTIKDKTGETLTTDACESYTLNGQTYTTSGTYTQMLTNAAGCDSTITLNLTIKEKTSRTIAATACDNYTLNSQTYTASGTYIQTLTNTAGCDSTLTLNLTIKENTNETLTASDCNSYTLNGQTYTASGTYIQTLTNAAGCDSTLTLNLTLNKTSETIIASACTDYTLNGQTYTETGTYTQTLTNAAGCDSVITLNLTINKTSETITASVCEEYILNGQTYTTSGTYTQTLTNAAGCDSVITLNLTINKTSETIIVSTCESYTLNGQTYTISGTFTQTLTNAAGCDSTITLNLSIKDETSETINVSTCAAYILNGQTYTASGTYTQTLTNAAGCDSTITLNLIINTVDTSVTNAEPVLTANANGAAYQWLDCNQNYAPISGETNQSFIATEPGSFAVIVTQNGCSDTSSCHNVVPDGIGEWSRGMNLKLSPNPTTGHLALISEMNLGEVLITIHNPIGQVIFHRFVNLDTFAPLELDEPAGIYLIKVSNAKGMQAVLKAVKLN